MLAHRLDGVLAQTDPFDLAQAVDRYVHALSAGQIHTLIRDALPRMNEYYAAEFSNVDTSQSEASLRSAFAQSLKSNLRAIPLFGPRFCEALLEQTPAERAVGFDEDVRSPSRLVAIGVVAVSLLAAAAGGAGYVSGVRSQSARTQPSPYIALVPAAVPVISTPHHRALRTAAPGPRVQRAPGPQSEPQVHAQPRIQPPAAIAQTIAAPAQKATADIPKRTPAPPVARGEAVVVLPQPSAAPAESPQTAPMDTSDMPQPYSDATPLPAETAATVAAPHSVQVTTPAPVPKRHGWLHRALMHLDPFKPRHPHP